MPKHRKEEESGRKTDATMNAGSKKRRRLTEDASTKYDPEKKARTMHPHKIRGRDSKGTFLILK